MDVNTDKIEKGVKDDLTETSRMRMERARKNMKERQEQARYYIRENPGKSMLIAAGAGATMFFILLMLMRAGKRYR